MRKNLLIAALLSLAPLSLAFQASKPTQWEYKQTCNFNDVKKLGAEGWELTAVEGNAAVSCFYLKRPM